MEQANKPAYPSIPMPLNNPDALYATVLALKQAVDMMVGNKGEERMPTMYTTEQPPQGPQAIDGDLWLSKAPTMTTLNVMVGGKWRQVGAIT
jgi:hypothetical protein